jgi:hypothetical protein
MHPTIVVPVLVAFGSGTPLACNAALRVWFEKSNPGMLTGWRELKSSRFDGLFDDYASRVSKKQSQREVRCQGLVWFVMKLNVACVQAGASANAMVT